MRDLVDIGGHEADCGDNKPKAEIVSDGGYYCVMVGNNCIARYDQKSDDYAYTNARKAAENLTHNAALTGGEAVPVESTVMQQGD